MEERYGFDEETVEEKMAAENSSDGNGLAAVEKPKRQPFAYWTVGGRDYRLKLTTDVICKLEEKFKRNLLSLLDAGIPPLAMMLTITQAAMRKYHSGMKYTDVQNLFDRYCEEGGTQLTFFSDVLMQIYNVSGFFSEDQQKAMTQRLEDAKEQM